MNVDHTTNSNIVLEMKPAGFFGFYLLILCNLAILCEAQELILANVVSGVF
jgi:hypothetical protein